MVVDHNFYMSLALQEAWKYQGLTYPNPAVGCTILGAHGEILAVGAHKRAGKPHAEVEALKIAYYKLTNDSYILALEDSADIHSHLLANHNHIFQNCSLYTTLEPCSHYGKTPSCASLIAELGIQKIYVGSYDTNEKARNGNEVLQRNGNCEVVSEVMKTECDALLYPFKKWLESRFVFFKWAQRLDGSTDSGVISSQKSREYVHAMRNVCDLLVIGGNTVRTDRPTLDARLVGGKAPDVLIYSRQKEFDKTIPLFGVEGREVFIEDNFSKLREYKNIMIEGTQALRELACDEIDYYLSYVAPSAENFEVLNTLSERDDIILWMKKRN